MTQAPSIDRLLNLVPDHPDTVLSELRANPQLASQQDAHGYSLLHAATSYIHLDLLRALIQDFNVDPNLTDEDGETCLFVAETVGFATELINLGVSRDLRNDDGQTAAEKLDDEDEQPEVAAYLKDLASDTMNGASSTAASEPATNDDVDGGAVHRPPPLPNGVQVNIGTMQESEVGGEPDPEFRRRIEELASREDFQGSEGQRELRDLVSEAVSGLSGEGQGPAARVRRT